MNATTRDNLVKLCEAVKILAVACPNIGWDDRRLIGENAEECRKALLRDETITDNG